MVDGDPIYRCRIDIQARAHEVVVVFLVSSLVSVQLCKRFLRMDGCASDFQSSTQEAHISHTLNRLFNKYAVFLHLWFPVPERVVSTVVSVLSRVWTLDCSTPWVRFLFGEPSCDELTPPIHGPRSVPWPGLHALQYGTWKD